MSSYKINKIRWPDEFRYAMNSIAENFDHHAEMKEGQSGITLNGLSSEQTLAFDIFMIGSEADEIIENLNMAISDLERLSENAKSFLDRNPFNRFKLLVRIFFYEYGRFEDIFAHFTQWKMRGSLMTKGERKVHRQAFYKNYEEVIKTRNVMMHDITSWEAQCSTEISILGGLELVGKAVIDKSGKQLTWDDHIGPLCKKTLPMMHAMGTNMQYFWNMEMADLALSLVKGGHLKKASKPYVGPDAADFLRVDPTYR